MVRLVGTVKASQVGSTRLEVPGEPSVQTQNLEAWNFRL